jgi:hypothetical protein
MVAATTADASIVTIGSNFSGAKFHTDPSIAASPPDTDGAVGPNYFVELLNNLYQVYDKSGALIQQLRLPDFWNAAGVTPAGLPFDPRVLYDPVSQRWFATSSENPFIPNDILVAVSNTSDPTQGWQGFEIPSDPSGQTWADFPMLGIDQDGIFIAANMYVAGTPDFSAEEIIAIPKSDLLQVGSDRGECDDVRQHRRERYRILPPSRGRVSVIRFGTVAFRGRKLWLFQLPEHFFDRSADIESVVEFCRSSCWHYPRA